MATMKALIIKSIVGVAVVAGGITSAVVFKPDIQASPTIQGTQTETTATTEVETPAPVSDTETKAETPTTSPKSTLIKLADLVVPKTEEEQDFEIDQSKIKNVEQDSTLQDHENRINDLENNVANQPAPLPAPEPVVEPVDAQAPAVALQKFVNSLTSNDFIVKNGGLYGTIGLSVSIFEDSQPSSGFSRIEYYLDGLLIGSSTNIDAKIAWNTTSHTDGAHQLSVKVYDKAGNIGTDSATVNIKNEAD